MGYMSAMGFETQERADLLALTEDVMKTSAIEGEALNRDQVRSSIARNLGINDEISSTNSKSVDGIVQVMLDATKNYKNAVTAERLYAWHNALFPTGYSGMYKIAVGRWRSSEHDPMQVISGAFGKEKVHFEAPPAERLDYEMKLFLDWYNEEQSIDYNLKAAIAHLWFVTIHPFEDGNGRIARALADMQLARAEQCDKRFYSMSSQILKERNHYYEELELCQKGTIDITRWLEWFLNCLLRAIGASHEILSTVLLKNDFWRKHEGHSLNSRQIKIINLMLNGFEGNLTSSKWASICKCSQDTASRDITNLIERNILVKGASGGRSTSYHLCDTHRLT